MNQAKPDASAFANSVKSQLDAALSQGNTAINNIISQAKAAIANADNALEHRAENRAAAINSAVQQVNQAEAAMPLSLAMLNSQAADLIVPAENTFAAAQQSINAGILAAKNTYSQAISTAKATAASASAAANATIANLQAELALPGNVSAAIAEHSAAAATETQQVAEDLVNGTWNSQASTASKIVSGIESAAESDLDKAFPQL